MGGGSKGSAEAGLKGVTYRPSSTSCLGGCTERRGSAVSLNFLLCFVFTRFVSPHLIKWIFVKGVVDGSPFVLVISVVSHLAFRNKNPREGNIR